MPRSLLFAAAFAASFAASDAPAFALSFAAAASESALTSGIVAPFPLAVSKGRAWYLVYRHYRESDAGLIAFRRWMRGQFKSDESRKRGARRGLASAPSPTHM